MIFFCEDCGVKNSLTEECINQGIVTFRCKACHYLNSYPLPGTTRASAVDKTPAAVDIFPEQDTETDNFIIKKANSKKRR